MNPAHAIRNRFLIYTAVCIRATATAMLGVLVAVYLARVGIGKSLIGVIVAAGLAGGATAALLATIGADAFGRRRFLFAFALLSAAGGIALAEFSNQWVLAGAAFAGMVNGMGKDRGAALAVEQAILPATTPDEGRTVVFAFYNVLQSAAAAVGALLAALPELLRHTLGFSELGALRMGVVGYALLMLVTGVLYLALSPEVEVAERRTAVSVSPQTRRILIKLSLLFSIDSMGGGFLTQALISYFFVVRFGVDVAMVGALYFAASIANAVSQLLAPLFARRFGLINTMVFTHLPSSLFLVGVAFAPQFGTAAVLFLLRECLVQMDVPARQSYVMAVVQPDERTFASGVTHLVRLAGWAIAPSFAGMVMEGLSLGTPLVIGAALKVTYDLLLYRDFRHLRPPEEQHRDPAHQHARA
jgi:MFS family permease